MAFAEKGEPSLIFENARLRGQNARKTQFLLINRLGICHWNGVLVTVDNADEKVLKEREGSRHVWDVAHGREDGRGTGRGPCTLLWLSCWRGTRQLTCQIRSHVPPKAAERPARR